MCVRGVGVVCSRALCCTTVGLGRTACRARRVLRSLGCLNRLALRNPRPMTEPLHMQGAEPLRHAPAPAAAQSPWRHDSPLPARTARDPSATAERGAAWKRATKHSCAQRWRMGRPTTAPARDTWTNSLFPRPRQDIVTQKSAVMNHSNAIEWSYRSTRNLRVNRVRIVVLAAWPLIVPPRPLRRAPENRARRASRTVKKGRCDVSTDTTAPSLLTGSLGRFSVINLENIIVFDFFIPWCGVSAPVTAVEAVVLNLMSWPLRSSSSALCRCRPRGWMPSV